jgi:hypothetical protein
MRIVFADPGRRLGTRFSPHDLLLWTMADLNGSAIARRGGHVEKLRKSDYPAALPYLVRVIPVLFVMTP